MLRLSDGVAFHESIAQGQSEYFNLLMDDWDADLVCPIQLHKYVMHIVLYDVRPLL